MNYIGIRGHRGSGKNTITYLLGNAIDYILSDRINGDGQLTEYDKLFRDWCDDIINDEQVVHNCDLKRVYIDSFSDTVKTLIALMLGCPAEYLRNDYYKDHMVINMKDFTYKVYDDVPDIGCMSHDELYNLFSKKSTPTTITKNIYVDLRNFILYFGIDVMQRYFGLNVWVKSLRANSALFNNIFDEDSSYKIYRDVKTPSEITYIKNLDGLIIKVERTGHLKRGGLDKLSQDKRFDYVISNQENLYDTKDDIKKIAIDIINKFKKHGEEK